jgi:hypothetical protein
MTRNTVEKHTKQSVGTRGTGRGSHDLVGRRVAREGGAPSQQVNNEMFNPTFKPKAGQQAGMYYARKRARITRGM